NKTVQLVFEAYLEGLTPDEVSHLTGTSGADKTSQVQGFKRYLADCAQL
ncbi:leucine-rich repeat-containing protein, partial [Pseudomonas amygdali pv. mori str. 301020]